MKNLPHLALNSQQIVDSIRSLKIPLGAAFYKLDIKEFKAMMVEKAHGRGVSTGEQLLELIPNAHPVGADWLVKTEHSGTYRFAKEVFEALPMWDWTNFFKVVDSKSS